MQEAALGCLSYTDVFGTATHMLVGSVHLQTSEAFCQPSTQCQAVAAAHLLLSTVGSIATACVAGVKQHIANSSPEELSSNRICAASPLAVMRSRPVAAAACDVLGPYHRPTNRSLLLALQTS